MTVRDYVLLAAGASLPSLLVAWLAAWGVRAWGPRFGLVDRPGLRKIHSTAMPTAGGLAIWLGLVVVFGLGHVALWLALPAAAGPRWPWLAQQVPGFAAPHLPGLAQQAPRLWLMLAGGTVLMLLGLWDDRRGLTWPFRLAVQTVVAVIMVVAGWRMTVFLDLPLLTGALSVIWIVGLVNSFNMLDNMDGLSAGVAAIAAAILAAAMLVIPKPDSGGPQLFVAGTLLVLLGSLAGFLLHNRPPARLFMGDAGAYLVGYLLATITLAATFVGRGAGKHGVLAPLCVLAVPIYDTITVVLIRLRSGRSPFVGDKSHFSHRLVELGMTKGQAVATIYLATATCGLTALLLGQVNRAGAAVIVLVVVFTLALIGILETAGRRARRQ